MKKNFSLNFYRNICSTCGWNASTNSATSRKQQQHRFYHIFQEQNSTTNSLFGCRRENATAVARNPNVFMASQRLAAIFENDFEILANVNVIEFKEESNSLNILWTDSHRSDFDYLWLRDNCRCSKCHHPQADERTLQTFQIPFNIKPLSVQLIEESGFRTLRIIWPAQSVDQPPHQSDYELRFLRENCYSMPATVRTQAYDGILWKADEMRGREPTVDYHQIITGVPNGDGYPERVAQRISFLRTTFWGDSWSVRSEPNPRNLSLTGVELFPHTDFTWSDTPPGLQFLHCVEFRGSNTGGESTLVDGYCVSEHLRQTSPESFRLLREVPIRHYFSGANERYSNVGTTLRLDKKGLVQLVRFNQANRAPLELDPELVRPFYKALHEFSTWISSKEFLLDFRLKEGQMLVFNNHRMLHGRLRYDAQTTSRHLKGCYLDLEQFESKYSLLNNTKKNHIRHQQSRSFSTATSKSNIPLDPGYDNYNQEFLNKALKKHEHLLNTDFVYEDGSSLKSVVEAKKPSFKRLDDGTKADFIYQSALFEEDIQQNLLPRLIGMLKKLEGEHIRLGTGAQVDLFEHSVQTATRAHLDGVDEEIITIALLHDIGELLCPMNHGEIATAILRPYISPEAYWILSHHEIFQVIHMCS